MSNTKYKLMSDAQLAACIKGGDHTAFETIFRRYYSWIHSFVFKILRDEELTDDITQDVFIRLWSRRMQIDCSHDIRCYLFQICRNKCLDTLRAMKRENMVIVSLSDQDTPDKSTTEDRTAFRDTEAVIAQSISELPTQRQTVFKMSRYMEMSNKEIAQELGLSVRTVDKHIELALKDIRKSIS